MNNNNNQTPPLFSVNPSLKAMLESHMKSAALDLLASAGKLLFYIGLYLYLKFIKRKEEDE